MVVVLLFHIVVTCDIICDVILIAKNLYIQSRNIDDDVLVLFFMESKCISFVIVHTKLLP